MGISPALTALTLLCSPLPALRHPSPFSMMMEGAGQGGGDSGGQGRTVWGRWAGITAACHDIPALQGHGELSCNLSLYLILCVYTILCCHAEPSRPRHVPARQAVE